jgi:hypothetical protein
MSTESGNVVAFVGISGSVTALEASGLGLEEGLLSSIVYLGLFGLVGLPSASRYFVSLSILFPLTNSGLRREVWRN